MHRPNIENLELAPGPDYIGISDVTGVQRYKALHPGYFTVGADIQNKSMAYSDVVAGLAPAVTATPPAAPAGSNEFLFIREYDDLVRVWRKVVGVWSHVFDLTKRTSTFISADIVHIETAIPIGGPAVMGTHIIVPTVLNGSTMVNFKASCYVGAGNTSIDLLVNGATAGCGPVMLVNAAVTTTVCAPTLNTDDIISFSVAGMAGTTQFGLSVTMEIDY